MSDLYIVWTCFNFHRMLIDTSSYSKFEIIQLQREESAANSNESTVERCFLFCKWWGHWHCHLLTDSLQSAFSMERICTYIFFPDDWSFCYTPMDLKKDFNALVPKLFWARPKSEFGEQPQPKPQTTCEKYWLCGWFSAGCYVRF